MKNAVIALATLLIGISLGLPSFAAPWATPGAACTQEGANANSNGFLTCTSGVWVSNAVLVGTTGATCDASTSGYIRYSGGQFQGCNGSSWVQLVTGGGNLKVYKDDGVTVVGNLVGSNGDLSSAGVPCVGLIYADTTTGQMTQLTTSECNIDALSFIYWTSTNCTGTSFFPSSSTYRGYCCTGSSTCTTNICTTDTSSSYMQRSFSSYRNGAGQCFNSSGSQYSYLTKTPTCGSSGQCLVK